jgi:hypothetical protein
MVLQCQNNYPLLWKGSSWLWYCPQRFCNKTCLKKHFCEALKPDVHGLIRILILFDLIREYLLYLFTLFYFCCYMALFKWLIIIYRHMTLRMCGYILILIFLQVKIQTYMSIYRIMRTYILVLRGPVVDFIQGPCKTKSRPCLPIKCCAAEHLAWPSFRTIF